MVEPTGGDPSNIVGGGDTVNAASASEVDHANVQHLAQDAHNDSHSGNQEILAAGGQDGDLSNNGAAAYGVPGTHNDVKRMKNQ